MSANTPAAAPAKSKKMLLIIIGVVVAVLVIGGGAAAWFISSRSHAAEDEEGGGAPAAHKESPKVAPTFLPMENMVVNLADPGGIVLHRLVLPWRWMTPKLQSRSSSTCLRFAAAF